MAQQQAERTSLHCVLLSLSYSKFFFFLHFHPQSSQHITSGGGGLGGNGGMLGGGGMLRTKIRRFASRPQKEEKTYLIFRYNNRFLECPSPQVGHTQCFTTTSTHTHMWTHTHTHTHMRAHAHTHTHACTHTQACTHARTHTHTQSDTHLTPSRRRPNSRHWLTTSFLQPLPYVVTPQGPENCQLTCCFLVGAQTVVSLLQTTQNKACHL